MGINIGTAGAAADSSAALASLNASTAMLTQTMNAQAAGIAALFGSLGLGTNVNAVV